MRENPPYRDKSVSESRKRKHKRLVYPLIRFFIRDSPEGNIWEDPYE